jgi:hypothetical protein
VEIGWQKKIWFIKKLDLYLYKQNQTTMSVTLEILKPLCEREFDPNETLQVLRHNPTIYWSWGVSKLVNVDNKGLLMKVNGHHHKGYVFVTLGYEDLYKVHILSTHGNLKQSFDGIWFDMLTEVIDNRIERIKDYVV